MTDLGPPVHGSLASGTRDHYSQFSSWRGNYTKIVVFTVEDDGSLARPTGMEAEQYDDEGEVPAEEAEEGRGKRTKFSNRWYQRDRTPSKNI